MHNAADTFATVVGDPIRVPDNPRHLMWVKPFARLIRITRKGQVLAETYNPLRLIELGHDLYGPQIYVPRSDVGAKLIRVEHKTFCPLKGHASYFDLQGPGGASVANNVAWSYEDPLEIAGILTDHIAFDPDQVEISEAPI